LTPLAAERTLKTLWKGNSNMSILDEERPATALLEPSEPATAAAAGSPAADFADAAAARDGNSGWNGPLSSGSH